MRLGQKRKVVVRLAVVALVATVAAVAVWGGRVVTLVDITWT